MKEKCWLKVRALDAVALGLLAVVKLTATGCISGGGDAARSNLDTKKAIEGLKSDPWGDPERIVAEVNGRQITQRDFYLRALEQFGTHRFLTGFITQELVLQEALKAGIRVTPEEVDRKVTKLLEDEELKAGGREKLARQYEDLGLTLEEAGQDRAREVESQLVLEKLIKSRRNVNDDVLREYYKVTYGRTRYATRHIAYSFRPRPEQSDADVPRLRLEANSRAARAADRIRKGADFTTLARAESQDTVTASRGGELGAIYDDPKVVPEFMRAVFKLGVSEVSDPVENPNGGYHIFQVTRIIPEESFVDCKEKMLGELHDLPPSEEEVRDALLKLRSGADVRVFPPPGRLKGEGEEHQPGGAK